MKMIRENIIILFLALTLNGNAQNVNDNIHGQVSYITNQHIYIKFRSTAGISEGDTLFRETGGKLIPALVVKNLSSTSCICIPLSGSSFVIAETVVAKFKPGLPKEKKDSSNTLSASVNLISSDTIKKQEEGSAQIIKGSISLNSYLDNSNTGRSNSERFRYTLSLDAKNISNSGFSFNTYASFRHKAGEWQEVSENVFNALKIFSLYANYDVNTSTRISFGRKINPFITNIGASDGMQAEMSMNSFTFGALAGSRPDYSDYGFNFNLFQYGAYAAYSSKSSGGYSESSVAIMQQTNNGNTDRRFIYFQHSNSLVKNLRFFTTFEADLYQMQMDTIADQKLKTNNFNLTGLYASLNYRSGRKFNFSLSYDARKNIVYYETYRTFLDRILEDEMRQGFRIQGSYRISDMMLAGLSAGYRFLRSDPHDSRNIHGYLSFNRVPALFINVTVSATMLESSYLRGNIFGFSTYKDFFKGKIQSGLGYRYIDYRVNEGSTDITQHIAEASVAALLSRKVFFGVNYEGTFEKNKYNRLYLQVRRKF